MKRSAPILNLVSVLPAASSGPHANRDMCHAVKAYIRKANILFAMREYGKALEAVEEATEQDTEHQHIKETMSLESKIQTAIYSQRGEETQEETLERAMRDPEVAVGVVDIWTTSIGTDYPNFQNIMNDPVYAANLATSTVRPQSSPGPHEEPRRAPQNPETDQCRHHQDEINVGTIKC